jgi:hypothetical protein
VDAVGIKSGIMKGKCNKTCWLHENLRFKEENAAGSEPLARIMRFCDNADKLPLSIPANTNLAPSIVINLFEFDELF